MYVLRAYDVGFNKCAHTCGSGATEDCDSWLPSESDAAFFEEGGRRSSTFIHYFKKENEDPSHLLDPTPS